MPPHSVDIEDHQSLQAIDTIFSSQTDMETPDLISAFQMLRLELQDKDIELYDQNMGNKLETFTCFRRLPLEIRLKIWRMSFPPGRKHEVQFKDLPRGSSLWLWKNDPDIATTPAADYPP